MAEIPNSPRNSLLNSYTSFEPRAVRQILSLARFSNRQVNVERKMQIKICLLFRHSLHRLTAPKTDENARISVWHLNYATGTPTPRRVAR
jgi:hypothetical protein